MSCLSPARCRAWRGRFLCLLIIAAATSGSAAEPQFDIQAWQSDDGAPRLGILSMAQGPDGYLWVASWDMRARFDGVRFTEFPPESTPALQGFGVVKIVTDRYGALWHATAGGGLAKWGPKGWERCLPELGEGHAVVELFGEPGGSALVVRADRKLVRWVNGREEDWPDVHQWGEPAKMKVCRDKNGAVWFVTDADRLVRVSSATNAVEQLPVGDLRGRRWQAAQADAAGELWVGTERELATWRDGRFVAVPAPAGEEPFGVEQIIPAIGQRLWVAANHHLWLWQSGRWVTNVCAWPPLGVPATARLADRNGRLWLGTRGHGLMCADTDGGVSVLTTQEGLPGDTITSLYEDRERNIWVGLDRAGLVRLRPKRFHDLGPQQGMSVPVVWTVCEDPAGGMWFGTEGGGLNRWKDGRFTRYDVGWQNTPGEVRSLFFDSQQTLWVGTSYKGLFHLENGALASPLDMKRIGFQVFAMYEDPPHRLWIGNMKGLYRWDRSSNDVRSFGPADGLTNTEVRAIVADQAGRMWVGTFGGGVARLDGDHFVHYGNPNGSAPMKVSGLYADAEGALWIGTIGDGLCCWRDGKLTRHTSSEGLPDDRITYLTEDHSGYLWLGSPGGIFRVSKRSLDAVDRGETNRLNCLAFDKGDGLPTRACTGGSQPACWRARDGRFWFSTDGGAVSFTPDQFNVNGLPPPVWIEEVLVDGRTATAETAPNTAETVTISPGQHTLELHYTATSLSAPGKVRFKCRMEGLEADWRDTAGERMAIYHHVPPGEYRFQVIACNNDGVWNRDGAFLSLTVLPQFWQTWWFKPLVGAGIILLVVAAYEIRAARARALAALRLRIGRDLHDEVGSNLSSIAMVAQMMQTDASGSSTADASEIRRIAKATVDSLRDIVWFLDPAREGMADLIARMQETANTLLRGVAFEFREARPPGPATLPVTFRRNALPIFKEILNNIGKHAQATRVIISVAGDARQFRLTVRDNGIGFDEARLRPGNGIRNLRRRAKEMAGTIEIHSVPGEGTTVTLRAPLPRRLPWIRG